MRTVVNPTSRPGRGLGDAWAPQVGLDEAHPVAGLGKRSGEVDRRGGLALAGHARW